jgi:hypothetical protein
MGDNKTTTQVHKTVNRPLRWTPMPMIDLPFLAMELSLKLRHDNTAMENDASAYCVRSIKNHPHDVFLLACRQSHNSLIEFFKNQHVVLVSEIGNFPRRK